MAEIASSRYALTRNDAGTHRGNSADRIKNLSATCAAWRPSRITYTTND